MADTPKNEGTVEPVLNEPVLSTDNSLQPVQTPEQISREQLIALVRQVTADPSKIVFPTDVWGFTSKVRKEVLAAAGSVRGQNDKHDLLVSTLTILLAHIKARKDQDKRTFADEYAKRQEFAEKRKHRERVTGAAPSLPNTVVVQ